MIRSDKTLIWQQGDPLINQWEKKMSERNWVQVASVQAEVQAELLRGLLEAQEIPVLLSREGAGRALGLTVGPLGDVHILVPDTFLAEATDILNQYQTGGLENLDLGDA
jgi:hypothetical protein